MATGRLFPHRTGRAHIVDRRTLGAELVAEGRRLHPAAIAFHFERGLQAGAAPRMETLNPQHMDSFPHAQRAAGCPGAAPASAPSHST